MTCKDKTSKSQADHIAVSAGKLSRGKAPSTQGWIREMVFSSLGGLRGDKEQGAGAVHQ